MSHDAGLLLLFRGVRKKFAPQTGTVIFRMQAISGLPHRIRAVIFDVDGTLLDSMPMWNSITYDYAALKGVAAPPGLSKTLNSLCLEQCAAYYRDVLGVSGTIETIMAEIVDQARERYRTVVPEIPGAAAFTAALKSRGIHTAIATASDIRSLWPALERLSIAPNIDIAESCTTIGKSKESPDIYLKCASDFGASPAECVVFEDALYAMESAKVAGCQAYSTRPTPPRSAQSSLRCATAAFRTTPGCSASCCRRRTGTARKLWGFGGGIYV